ncbi:P-loop-containing nucleoside triphosphate hydrolase [Chloropicon primus]|nr:P-loop-containing nucleoside triphosphate hydrolase [Chloropicon primus]
MGSKTPPQPRKGLLYQPERIRNMCILAHVDHGKTTLSDYLIASNGYVHPKLAGKQRFLDWREEEQTRGITMKSSSIALLHVPRGENGEPSESEKFIVNLIDSPGHVDFCSEVSSAARLADGALLVVDAIEGVCVQTHAVIRQALSEKVKLCLVINKLDRLIDELKFSTLETYVRLVTIIHDVNNVVSSFTSEKYIESQDDEDPLVFDVSREIDDDKMLFSPSRGNVAFACSLEGWAFRLNDFAKLYAKKLNCNSESLQKALWGPYTYNAKTKKVTKIKASEEHKKPMFVQMVLDPIWQSYQILELQDNHATAVRDLSRKLGISIQEKEIQRLEPVKMLQLLLSRWLPLCDSVMSMVIEHLPNTQMGAKARFNALLNTPGGEQMSSEIEETISKFRFEPEDEETVGFVSKMIVVPTASLPQDFQNSDSENTYLAFGRIFAGTLKVGQTIHVLSPKYSPRSPDEGRQEVVVTGLFLMKGRDIDALPAAGAGNMVAIAGLGEAIHRSATLSSTTRMYPFSPMTYQSAPILRKAVEPKNPADLQVLTRGLKLLYKADPFVEIESSKEGEHIICAAGEVHMESCIKELTESFARIEILTSPPLVTFKETVRNEVSFHKGLTTQNGMCSFVVKTSYVSDDVAKLIMGDKQGLSEALSSVGREEADPSQKLETVKALEEIQSSGDSSLEAGKIWSLGPEYVGPNLLCTGSIVLVSGEEAGEKVVAGSIGKPLISEKLRISSQKGNDKGSDPGFASPLGDGSAMKAVSSILSTLEDGIKSAFQMVTAAGPMCDEALYGVVFTVDVEVNQRKLTEYSEGGLASTNFGPLSGQVISACKESLRGAIMTSSPRLVEAYLRCDILTSSTGLAGTYASIGSRQGYVVREDMREGSDIFLIKAFLPLADSFGFVDELRKRSSGISSATLSFSHWRCNEEDPYFVPKTEEEREEHGEISVLKNRSRKLLDGVRKRKGLLVEEKLVASATKQRTLAKKV